MEDKKKKKEDKKKRETSQKVVYFADNLCAISASRIDFVKLNLVHHSSVFHVA